MGEPAVMPWPALCRLLALSSEGATISNDCGRKPPWVPLPGVVLLLVLLPMLVLLLCRLRLAELNGTRGTKSFAPLTAAAVLVAAAEAAAAAVAFEAAIAASAEAPSRELLLEGVCVEMGRLAKKLLLLPSRLPLRPPAAAVPLPPLLRKG